MMKYKKNINKKLKNLEFTLVIWRKEVYTFNHIEFIKNL